MFKSTIYLPTKLKRRLKRLARRRGQSEASLIRDALERLMAAGSPRPRPGLFRSGDSHLAERVDEALEDVGE
ncbi:MAG TPA: ribbon-helix-helix protein, CopG family [Verrucomicrobiae bacterium]|nr:ribbon-helix-helix protein, CopG family [Verrucomicrobiae bacterium]